MDERCPFCWDRNINQVNRAAEKSSNKTMKRLMQCSDCEKWYWADSGEEVSRLSEVCETSHFDPGKCYEELKQVIQSGGKSFPKRRTVEFNHLCSWCPNRRFTKNGNLFQVARHG